MRIAVAADEPGDVDAWIVHELGRLGHEVVRMGALADGAEHPWAKLAEQVVQRIPGDVEEAVLICWTGTGVSIAANKISGVRAALCGDATTAAAARVWNHANVLCLSHRTLSKDLATEILEAWFRPYDRQKGAEGVAILGELDRRNKRG